VKLPPPARARAQGRGHSKGRVDAPSWQAARRTFVRGALPPRGSRDATCSFRSSSRSPPGS
jgi:hypothetical protein